MATLCLVLLGGMWAGVAHGQVVRQVQNCLDLALIYERPTISSAAPKDIVAACERLGAVEMTPSLTAARALALTYQDKPMLAVSLARQAHEAGVAQGTILLADSYLAGVVEGQSPQYGVTLLQTAAEAGNAHAQYRLGLLLGVQWHPDLGIEQDASEAAQWFREAAIQGLPAAQYQLAYAFQHGIGVPKNQGTALALYNQAACNGNVDAMLLRLSALGPEAEFSQAALGTLYLGLKANGEQVAGRAFWGEALARYQSLDDATYTLPAATALLLAAWITGNEQAAKDLLLDSMTPWSATHEGSVLMQGLDQIFDHITGQPALISSAQDPKLQLSRVLRQGGFEDVLVYARRVLSAFEADAGC